MPAQFNPNSILAAVGPEVPLNDLSSVYKNAIAMREGMDSVNANAASAAQRQLLNQGYQAATGPDGSIDPAKLQSYLAANGGGQQIPGVQKAYTDLAHTQAETAQANATTANTNVTAEAAKQKQVYDGLKQVDSSIASLASDPTVNEQKVYGEMGRLVNAGAFTAQAAHMGVTPDAYAKNMLSTMPVGDPQALKGWLIQAGLRVADATKRLETVLPKYDAQDRGGVINQGTINQVTGQRTDGPNVAKTATPGEVLSAQTTRRGQDLSQPDDVPDDQIESVARMIANKQIPALSPYAMSRPGGMKVMAKVAEIDPNFQGADYGTNSATLRNFAQGALGNKTRAFNTSMSHLDLFSQLVSNLNNTSSPAYNAVANTFKQQIGSDAPTNVDAAKGILGKELTAMIVSGGGGEKERLAMESTLANANSPQQLAGVIDTYRRLGGGQLTGLKQQYEAGTGRKDFERLLSPASLAAMSHMNSTTPGAPASQAPQAPAPGTRPSLDSFFVR